MYCWSLCIVSNENRRARATERPGRAGVLGQANCAPAPVQAGLAKPRIRCRRLRPGGFTQRSLLIVFCFHFFSDFILNNSNQILLLLLIQSGSSFLEDSEKSV